MNARSPATPADMLHLPLRDAGGCALRETYDFTRAIWVLLVGGDAAGVTTARATAFRLACLTAAEAALQLCDLPSGDEDIRAECSLVDGLARQVVADVHTSVALRRARRAKTEGIP